MNGYEGCAKEQCSLVEEVIELPCLITLPSQSAFVDMFGVGNLISHVVNDLMQQATRYTRYVTCLFCYMRL